MTTGDIRAKAVHDALRIGLIADNHTRQPDGGDLPESVLKAFEGLDLILHLGDAGNWASLDRLETVAPVVGVLGGQNGEAPDPRIEGRTRTLQLGLWRVGLVHDLAKVPDAVALEAAEFPAFIEKTFGGRIDLLAYAGTHKTRIGMARGFLYVNPGSPTLPAPKRPGLQGHLAIVELGENAIDARIIELATDA